MLVIWVIGSLWLDGLWATLVVFILGYLLLINPAIYVQYWADSNFQWAQMWMARNYSTGQGGLTLSESTARRWYQKAALNGNSDAQYRMGRSARRGKEAKKWYLLAAEQGHTAAMVQLARSGLSSEERYRWLMLAADKRHPEALYILAEKKVATDLAAARRLLLDAADNGSRTAIVHVAAEYLRGGVLFEQNDLTAEHWLSTLEKRPPSGEEPVHLTPEFIAQTVILAKEVGSKIHANDAETLYQQAKLFLGHSAKDQILRDRTVNYLSRAANQGHGEAALELARLAMQDKQSKRLSDEGLKWYTIAAENDNLKALKKLSVYYKELKDGTVDTMQQSLDYNERLLKLLPAGDSTSRRFTLQHWSSEYRDTQKRLAQLKRLGGSWKKAAEQAAETPQKEYLLAKELLKDRQYAEGMKHLKSAAQRDNHQARFELAVKTLRGPRSFSEEIAAVSELQTLDRQGMLAASLNLGSMSQSGTGLVPRNYYLARQLFRKALVDSQLSEKAQRWLSRGPDFTDNLQLRKTGDASEQIEAWYQQMLIEVEDKAILGQQREALLDHFRDIDGLKHQAVEGDARAQYLLAQTLQSHNLAKAVEWLQRAAENGNGDAQYELAVRMIRGKKNTPEQQQELKKWAVTAADSGHTGALAFLAAQYRTGYGGFEKNSALARDYYQKALHSSDAGVLFSGKVAGKELTVRRSHIQNRLSELKELKH